MVFWVAFQQFVAFEVLVGTALALWIGFLAWRGPTHTSRGRFRRILKPNRVSTLMVFRRVGHLEQGSRHLS